VFHVDGVPKAQCRFIDAWAFPSDVQPLFPVPSCVLVAERSSSPKPLPSEVRYFSGHLARRDADRKEADKVLVEFLGAWPDSDKSFGGSPYRSQFRNGAVLWPRRLVLVEPIPSGRLGHNPAAPLVRGRVTSLDKRPWKEIEPLEGPIEAQFLRLVHLGESIAPFRTLTPVLGVIPIDPSTFEVLDSEGASRRGFSHLARWLKNAASIWNAHSKQTRSFTEQINYFENL
jgi:hypothetical protein